VQPPHGTIAGDSVGDIGRLAFKDRRCWRESSVRVSVGLVFVIIEPVDNKGHQADRSVVTTTAGLLSQIEHDRVLPKGSAQPLICSDPLPAAMSLPVRRTRQQGPFRATPREHCDLPKPTSKLPRLPVSLTEDRPTLFGVAAVKA